MSGFENDLRELDQFYIPTSCANAFHSGSAMEHYTKRQAEEAIHKAARILEECKGLLPRDRFRYERERLLRLFLQEIEPLEPKTVILFGSHARGDFTDSSDIDVCVLAEKLPSEELRRRSLGGLYKTHQIRAL